MPRINYKIDEQGYGESLPSIRDRKPQARVVDKSGRPQQLSSYQKNALYKQAREIKEKMKDGMCSKKQCWDTDERAIRKMQHSEMRMSPEIKKMKQNMKAIGADPRDFDPERVRRRR